MRNYLSRHGLNSMMKKFATSLKDKEDVMEEVTTDEMAEIWNDVNFVPVIYYQDTSIITIYDSNKPGVGIKDYNESLRKPSFLLMTKDGDIISDEFYPNPHNGMFHSYNFVSGELDPDTEYILSGVFSYNGHEYSSEVEFKPSIIRNNDIEGYNAIVGGMYIAYTIDPNSDEIIETYVDDLGEVNQYIQMDRSKYVSTDVSFTFHEGGLNVPLKSISGTSSKFVLRDTENRTYYLSGDIDEYSDGLGTILRSLLKMVDPNSRYQISGSFKFTYNDTDYVLSDLMLASLVESIEAEGFDPVSIIESNMYFNINIGILINKNECSCSTSWSWEKML